MRAVVYLLVAFLLAGGCKEKPTETTTPLHRAARTGDVAQAKSLISSDADINAKDSWGNTPLHLATEKGHKDLLELLITNGADVNAKDDSGRTPLMLMQRPNKARRLWTVHSP